MEKLDPTFIPELKKINIGRSLDNNIILEAKDISRYHSTILACGLNTFLLEDLNSKNGSFVNGQRIGRKFFSAEDQLSFAKNHFAAKDILQMGNLILEKDVPNNTLDYTKAFEEMKHLENQYKLFKSEEVNIQNAIRKVNEALRLSASLTPMTLVIISTLTGGAGGVIATIGACGLGMLIPAIGSRFLKEEEKLIQPKLHFNNNWKCPKCGDKPSWMGKSWEYLAKQKRCNICDAIWVI